MYGAGLYANFAFTWRDDARAVRADQAHTQLVTLGLDQQHILHWNPFGDADYQRNTGKRRFQYRIFTKCGRHINHRSIGTGLLHRLFHRIEDRQPQVRNSTFARRDPTHHIRAIVNRLLRVKGALRASKALANNPCAFINQNTHALPSAAATTSFAASSKLGAGIVLSPLAASMAAPSAARLPSSRTTTGICTPTSLTAEMIPSAIMSQRTMPPNMLTSTARTLSSSRMILNASDTRPVVVPPPTSRKLAGRPPYKLTMSMVPMASPAPLTMHPMLPSSAT